MVFGSVSEDAVIARLVELGWTAHDVRASMVLSSSNAKWFGPLWVTTTIRDYIGRPVGFVSRNLSSNGPKYINSCDNELYKKGDHLLGLNTALKSAKHLGLYVVEGPGDLAQLRRLGIRNSVAIAGTSFTADHLLLLKSLGIRTIFFCLDWDQAGQTATARIFKEILKHGQGIGCHVILQPEGDFKDPDEYLVTQDTPDGFLGLKSKTAFEYTISNLPEHLDPADVCIAMIPIIAIEPLSVRRDAMVQQLSESTGIHFQSIISDVNNIRDNKYEERKERLRAAGQKYMRGLEKNPDEASSLLGQHEDDIRNIERDYERDIIGPMYQLAKFETVEDQKIPDTDGNTKTKFIFKYYKNFGDAISGGLQHTSGTLIYFPGRQNSGKTATMIALSVDVLLHDPDAIVMYHFTDDDYATVQPRIKTNICMMTLEPGEKCLTIGQAADPWANITDAATWQTYHRVDALMRELIREEKLVIVDSEEGNTFATLERQLSYIRRKHPETKLLTVCDKRIVTFHG
jgi:hypothetical protein